LLPKKKKVPRVPSVVYSINTPLLRRQNVESGGNLLLPRETVLAVDLGVRTKVLAL
jgi:hypothetical protein